MKIASAPPPPDERGFSLVEVMTVIAIVGILVAIAVPSFNTMIDRQNVKNAASDIYVVLVRARSEALKLNQSVTIIPKSETEDWTSGWSIDNPLYPGSLLADHLVTRGASVTGPLSVTYRSSGRTTEETEFVVTGKSAARYVCLDLSGRPTIKTTSC